MKVLKYLCGIVLLLSLFVVTHTQGQLNPFTGVQGVPTFSRSVLNSGFNTNILEHWYWGFAQGGGYDETLHHWILNNTGNIYAEDDNRSYVLYANSSVLQSMPGGLVNYLHLGDGDCFSGHYFVPAEKYIGGVPLSENASIAVVNTTNLAFNSYLVVSNLMPEISTLVIAPSSASTADLYAFGQDTVANRAYRFSITGATNISFVSSNTITGMPNELVQGSIFAYGSLYVIANVTTNAAYNDIYRVDTNTYAATFIGKAYIPGGTEGEGAIFHDNCLVLAEGATGCFYWFNLGFLPTVSTDANIAGSMLVSDLPKGGRLNPNQQATNTFVDGRVGNVYGWNNYYTANGAQYPFMVFGVNGGGGGNFPAWAEGVPRFGNITDQLILGDAGSITSAPGSGNQIFAFGCYNGDFGINNTNPAATVDVIQKNRPTTWASRPVAIWTPLPGITTNIFQINGTNQQPVVGVTSNGIFLARLSFQAGHTNVTSATSVFIAFSTPLLTTNYTANVVNVGAALGSYYPSGKTTNGFTANFTTLTSGDLDWSVITQTQ
jgi:hypothetical protein